MKGKKGAKKKNAKKKTAKKKPAKKVIKKKSSKKKRARPGQPSKKESIDLEKVKKLCIAGCTQEQIAICCDVSLASIKNYMKSDPQFLAIIKDNAKIADVMVKRSLWERACGYSHEDTYFATYQGMIFSKTYTKHYPPDAVSCIFWLTNRQPDEWKRGSKEAVPKGLLEEEIVLIPSNGKAKGNGNAKGIPAPNNRIKRFLE